MSENNSAVGVSNSHTEVEATIKEFQRAADQHLRRLSHPEQSEGSLLGSRNDKCASPEGEEFPLV